MSTKTGFASLWACVGYFSAVRVAEQHTQWSPSFSDLLIPTLAAGASAAKSIRPARLKYFAESPNYGGSD